MSMGGIRLGGDGKIDGIEKLTGLTDLDLRNNDMGSELSWSTWIKLDFSHNTKLVNLNLSDNHIEEVNLSNNVDLVNLDLSGNRVGSYGLDLSNNTKLVNLNLASNFVDDKTVLDLSNNLYLETLNLDNNGLSNLDNIDISQNLNLKTLDLHSNRFSNLDNIDISQNSNLETNNSLENLYINDNNLSEIDVRDFTNLKELDVSGNERIESLDLSNNSNLTRLWASGDNIHSIIFPENSELLELHASMNKLKSINLDSLTKLQWVDLSGNELEELHVDKNIELVGLILGWGNDFMNHIGGWHAQKGDFGNLLKSIDVSKNTKLKYLNISSNKIIDTIDVSHNPELKQLIVSANKDITSLDVSLNPNLFTLIADDTRLSSLDITNNINLRTLAIRDTDISEINLVHNRDAYDGEGYNKLSVYNLSANNNILVDLGLEPIPEEDYIYEDLEFIPEGGYVYRIKNVDFLKDTDHQITGANWVYSGGIISSSSPDYYSISYIFDPDDCSATTLYGYGLGVLVFDIEDTDNYSYDKDNGILTIINPDAINGSVPIVGKDISYGLDDVVYRLKLWDSVDEEDDKEEEVVVPNTAAPETGIGGFMQEKGVLLALYCGWILLPMGFIILKIVRRHKKKRCEIESL